MLAQTWYIEDDLEDLPYLRSLATTLTHLNKKADQLAEETVAPRRGAAADHLAARMGQRLRRLRALTTLIDDELETTAAWEAEALNPADDESLFHLSAEIRELARQAG